MGKTVARLFTQFQPNHYDLALKLDIENKTFEGSVIITGKKVGRPSQRLTFHQKDLDIYEATLRRKDKKGEKIFKVERINRQNSFDEVRLHCDEMLYPGEYTIMLHFRSKITDGMTGIYPCNFQDGETAKQLIMTQFESHHAREAFPCIDEPEAKATFSLTLNTPDLGTVLSNTLPLHSNVIDDRRVTEFEKTPRMSTYLLAFIFGELHHKAAKTKRGTAVKIWGTVAQPAESFDFALDAATRSIEFFEDYFGIDYPLPKADHVACPDFSSGAMENWGLITYRERVLLAYPGETSQSVLEQIATVIAHETSHQWFGNLVTMKWWDDLWLNESFANMMEYEAVDSMYPEWQVWNTFIAAEGLSAFRRDAVAGVQAVKTAVNHPDEISSLFDPSIVYAKGGRLLYMLKNYIGEDAFRTGLRQYFTKHAYGNTEGVDLWDELGAASGKDIAAFMDPWLTRSGFPLLTINQDGGTADITQEQFCDDPTKADAERLWPVPLFSDAADLPEALLERTTTIELPSADTALFNVGARGHYLVRYLMESQKDSIQSRVADQSLGESDRLMLLNSGSMLARAGYEPYSTVLQLLEAYRNEASEPVWDIIALILSESRRFIDEDDSLEPAIKAFTGRQIVSQYERLGWVGAADESAADQKLRALILGLGVYSEHPAITAKALEMFSDHIQNGAALPPELKALIFLVPVKQGDQSAFEYLLQLHDTTQNSDLKGDACDALTATRDSKQAAQLLARLKEPALVKPQDVDRWLVYLLRNRYVRDTAWQWMVDNWHWLEETFKNDKSYDYLPRYAASVVSNRTYQQKYRDLFESKTDQPLLKRNILMGMEEIATRVAWLERDLAGVQKFFNQYR